MNVTMFFSKKRGILKFEPLRPNNQEKTGSRLITEVKSGWAK